MNEQVQDPKWWSEEDFAWWSKGKKGKKGLSKSNDGFQKCGFRPYQLDRGAGKDFPQNKGRGKDQKGRGKDGTCPQSGLSASETPSEEGHGHAWESDDWSSSHWLDFSCWVVHESAYCMDVLQLH